MHVAARSEGRTFGSAGGDVREYALAMRGGDERSHLRFVVERIADVHLSERLDERLREAMVDRTLHQDAAARATILAGVAEGGGDGRGDGAIEIAILEDQVGRLAAELQADSF